MSAMHLLHRFILLVLHCPCTNWKTKFIFRKITVSCTVFTAKWKLHKTHAPFVMWHKKVDGTSIYCIPKGAAETRRSTIIKSMHTMSSHSFYFLYTCLCAITPPMLMCCAATIFLSSTHSYLLHKVTRMRKKDFCLVIFVIIITGIRNKIFVLTLTCPPSLHLPLQDPQTLLCCLPSSCFSSSFSWLC